MTYILLGIIILQWVYIIYKEESVKRERSDLQLKLMSKNLTEYKEVTELPEKNTEKEDSPYRDIEDIPVSKLLKAEDSL